MVAHAFPYHAFHTFIKSRRLIARAPGEAKLLQHYALEMAIIGLLLSPIYNHRLLSLLLLLLSLVFLKWLLLFVIIPIIDG